MDPDTPLPPCLFTTFGMFIIDKIEWPDNKHPTQTDLIGGAGTYAALGARLALSPSITQNPTLPGSVSWIVDTGSDFPPSLTAAINSWRTNCIFRHDSTRLTTRAWNGYGPGDFRAFKYVTPKRRLEVSDLDHRQLQAQSFHMVCSAERCQTIISELSTARAQLSQTQTSQDARNDDSFPVIVWEPIPDLCTPEELIKVRNAAASCTIISPNHDELLTFFSKEEAEQTSQHELVMKLMGWNESTPSSSTPDTSSDTHSDTNTSTSSVSVLKTIQTPICIIREGSNGSTAYIRLHLPTHTHQTQVQRIHIPAFHTPALSHRVIDPTGGGNTYLGALAVSLTRSLHAEFPDNLRACFDDLNLTLATKLQGKLDGNREGQVQQDIMSLMIAMAYAGIAASFAIEQFGVPQIQNKHDDADQESTSEELWNDQAFSARLREYLLREHDEHDFTVRGIN